MSSIKSVLYSATCNPPRHAKRTRTQPCPAIPLGHLSSRPILPNPPSHVKDSLPETDELDEDDKDDSDYEEPLMTPPPTTTIINTAKRRGRKPGNLSRSTRESLRKQNHSRIEKARRTKINDALDTLRTLVPDEYRTRCREEEAMLEDGDKKVGKKDKEQKEFKLEVLVRTVAYLKDLMMKVKTLEDICGSVENSTLPRDMCLKRKRDQCDEGPDEEEDKLDSPLSSSNDGDVQMEKKNIPSTPIKSPTLPSISSWLPQALADSSSLPVSHPNKAPQQLPSPPLSDTIRPRSNSASQISSTIFPSLSLPSPIATFPGISSHLFASSFTSTTGTSHSPEDESAATLLLHMKSASKKPIQTPGSVLGIDPGR